MLDHVIDNPNPDLEFSINTNLNPPDDIFDKFIEKIQIIVNEGKVRRFKLFTSAEAHGAQCEYIRYGMNYSQWLTNIYKIYEAVPDIEFTIMSTYNILSIPSYIKFLDDILAIKKCHGSHRHDRNPMLLDIPYLRFPQHQAVFLADKKLAQLVSDQVAYMYRNLEYRGQTGIANRGFYEHEADKLKRVYEMVAHSIGNKNEYVDGHRRNFVKFVNEHDRRRGTDFLSTFPEFQESFNEWSKL